MFHPSWGPGVTSRPRGEELWIGFVPFSPLGKGWLTGTINDNPIFKEGDLRNVLIRFAEGARQANLQLVRFIGEIARRKGTTPAQTALA